MKKLTREEISTVEKLFSKLCVSPEALDQKLQKSLGDSWEQTKKDIEDGVDRFYGLYAGNVNEEAVRKLLEKNMEGLSKEKQYSYLANVLLALTHLCGNVLEGDTWSKALEEHRIIMKAVDMGLMEKDETDVQRGIEQMLQLIMGNVEACSVLLLGDPPYEKLFKACLTEEPSKIEALAVNTRSASVNMAAALYILQEEGKLPSLKDSRIPAGDMGIMAASLMEIDAACKSGSWEKAKKVVEKAAKTVAILIITSPDLLKDMMFFTLVSVMTNFSLLWMMVAGVILTINIRIRQNAASAHLEPVFATGARMLSEKLEQIRSVSGRFTEWVQTTVLSRAIPCWEKCRDFAVNSILIPAASFLIQAKNEVLQKAHIAVERVRAALERLRQSAENIVQRAKDRSEEDTSEELDELDENEVEEGVSQEYGETINEDEIILE